MNDYYKATDRRVYNGALCSDMKKEQDSLSKLERKAAKLGARATYFPMEGKWSVWSDFRRVSDMYSDKGAALVEFLDNEKGITCKK